MRKWVESKGVTRTEPEYELADSLAGRGCSLCRLALRTSLRQLDIISYEAVNDIELREKLRASRGFCWRHGWAFLEETRDPLGAALIYRDITNTLSAILVRPERPFSPSGLVRTLFERSSVGRDALSRDLMPTRQCLICQAEEATVETYSELLVRAFEEKPAVASAGTESRERGLAGIRAAYLESDGLCHSHLLATIGRAKSQESRRSLAHPSRPSLPSGNPSARAESDGPVDFALYFGSLQAPKRLIPQELSVEAASRRIELSRARRKDDLPPESLEGAPRSDYQTSQCGLCESGAARLIVEERGILAQISSASNAERVVGETLSRLCSHHAWRLVERAQESGATEQESALFRGASAALVRSREELARSSQSKTALTPCPLCQKADEINRDLLQSHNTQSSEAGTPSAPSPLCLTHLSGWLRSDLLPSDVFSAGRTQQLTFWKELSGELGEFIRKHDYRFTNEPFSSERSASWRALMMIAGRGKDKIIALPVETR